MWTVTGGPWNGSGQCRYTLGDPSGPEPRKGLERVLAEKWQGRPRGLVGGARKAVRTPPLGKFPGSDPEIFRVGSGGS